jgi:two-component system, OmpR family, response regulator BaeR
MSIPTILIAEDDDKIARLLEDYLAASHFATLRTADGRHAIDMVRTHQPEALLLDLNLRGLDGLEVCKAVRAFSQLPIMMITARIDEVDRVLGLELGADDYLCKPFSPREVVARVKALLRRAAGTPRLADNALVLDDGGWRASLEGTPLSLTVVEFKLLRALAKHPGRVYSRAQLLEFVDRTDLDTSDRAVDSHIKNLRRKLDHARPGHEWIRSVYGVGYAWQEKLTR